MLRAGFFLGFLTGAGVASLFSDTHRAEAPGAPDAAGGVAAAGGLLGGLRSLIQEMKVAAQQAAAEKELEMRRQFEQTTRRL